MCKSTMCVLFGGETWRFLNNLLHFYRSSILWSDIRGLSAPLTSAKLGTHGPLMFVRMVDLLY
jgi:hypothetical protein